MNNQNEINALEHRLNELKKQQQDQQKQTQIDKPKPTLTRDQDLNPELVERYKKIIANELSRLSDKTLTQSARVDIWTQALFKGERQLDYLIHLDYCFFNKNKITFINACDDFYNYKAQTPKWRVNFVLCGKGGSGKSTLAHLMPAALKSDSFTCVDLDSGLSSYYGQKTIIWDELRSSAVLNWSPSKFFTITNTGGNNKGVIKVLYGYKQPLNNYNIITTSESYKSFLNRICNGNENHIENSDQITRRFPYVLSFQKTYNFENNHWNTEIDLLVHDPLKVEQENIDSLDGYTKKIQFNFQTTEENFEIKLNQLAKLLASAIDETHRIDLNKIKNDFKQHFQNDEDHLIKFD